jgi:hypothetical protein
MQRINLRNIPRQLAKESSCTNTSYRYKFVFCTPKSKQKLYPAREADMSRPVISLAEAKREAQRRTMLSTLEALLAEARRGILTDILIVTRDAGKRRRLVALGGLDDDDLIIALLERSLQDMCRQC